MRRADDDVRARVAATEALLERVEALPPPSADTALEAVGALVALYGEALARIVAAAGPDVTATLAADELVGHLFIVHDLHPLSTTERVARALDEVRPYLGTHGGGVELVAVDETVVRVALAGTCHGCPSSIATLRHAIEKAVLRAAPEIARVEAVGLDAPGRDEPRVDGTAPLVCAPEIVARADAAR